MKDAKRLITNPGIGEITATAVVATVNDAKNFDTSRSFAEWIGLVPRCQRFNVTKHLKQPINA